MAKLTLKANPTFSAEVGIPLHGGGTSPVALTFKHRTMEEMDQFIKDRPSKTDVQTFMEMVEGWDLEDEFTETSVQELLQNYNGAGLAAFRKYIDELVQARQGN
jgi:hypothetical protein